jgi:hypothetical protein
MGVSENAKYHPFMVIHILYRQYVDITCTVKVENVTVINWTWVFYDVFP